MESVKIAKNNIKKLNRLFVWGIGVVELLLLGLMVLASFFLYPKNSEGAIFKVVALDLVLLWIGILIAYYSWATYHYNINFGLTNEDWARMREKEENGEEVPDVDINPNHEKTLGLPEGTVRGTLALTLAIGAMSMLIASLGMNYTLPMNEFFVDVFDFFKTAFLMMIAFYFGNKSLQYLNYGAGPVKGGPQQNLPQGYDPATPAQQSGTDQPPIEPATSRDASDVRSTLNNPAEGVKDVGKMEDRSDFDKLAAKG